MKLLCKEFNIQVSAGYPPHVEAVFMMPISPLDTDDIAEALKSVTLYLSKEIELVLAKDNQTRCFYCATLHDDGTGICEQCGAPLL